jgi:hypothetical protein
MLFLYYQKILCLADVLVVAQGTGIVPHKAPVSLLEIHLCLTLESRFKAAG